MWQKLVLIAMAGACGTLARYGLAGLVQRWSGAGFPWGTVVVNILGCLLFGIIGHSEFIFTKPPGEITRDVYGANPFPESVEIARYIRNRTDVADTIVVLGSEPQIYFYAKRRAATGYIYTYSLMEKHEFARRMQEQMIAEIEAG